MRGKLQVVVGGQYGSEGKGAICAWLAQHEDEQFYGVRVAGPNAGHTVVNPANGRKIPLRHIPVSLVVRPDAIGYLAPGSEIDEQVLHEELDLLDRLGLRARDRLMVSTQATVITSDHKMQESHSTLHKTGTTGKGIGAARAARVMREAPLYSDGHDTDNEYHSWRLPSPTPGVSEQLNRILIDSIGTVQIEGTQGFALGMHAGWYPHCTSSDCRAVDFIAMAGIVPWEAPEVETWVCLRTYPIRIAGNSGPMYNETTWEALGEHTNGYIKPEQTTVTHKTRRVGAWDHNLARRAVEANGRNSLVALTFFDYWFPELAGATDLRQLRHDHIRAIHEVERDARTDVGLIGTGPATAIDLR